VIERVVNDPDDTPTNCYIDLASGKLSSKRAAGSDPLIAWVKSHHVDAQAHVTFDKGRLLSRGLYGLDLFTLHENDAWERAKATEVQQQLAGIPPEDDRIPHIAINFMTSVGNRPETYLFRTRDGCLGILQITGISDKPRGVKIRYKLVQQPNQIRGMGGTSNHSNAPVAITAQGGNLVVTAPGGKVVITAPGGQVTADRIELGQATTKPPVAAKPAVGNK
jgi:hypothetical protein